MGYGRVIKSSTYHSRKRVPMKRRRECKTNYKKRHTMIRQNLNKPNFQQTRLVVRITNSQVICQMVKAYPAGDATLASASSTELRNFKYTFGLKNYTACYLTGLLLGMRVMRQSRLHKIYRGNRDANALGMSYLERNLVGKPATYRAILDMGLKRPTKGSKIFAALKGVTDAGVYVPHKPKLFFGFSKDSQELDSEKLSDRIRAVDLSKYAASQLEAKKNHQFSKWYQNALIFPQLVDQTIANIKKNPKRLKPSSAAKVVPRKPLNKVKKMKKKAKEERRADIEEQKVAWMESMALAA